MATKYVSSAASGSDDGTSATHTSGTTGPWTLAQAISATLSAGDELRIMADGTYTRSATWTYSTSGTFNTANIVITGANSSGTVDGTKAILQASAGSITLLSSSADHVRIKNLTFDGNSQTSVSGLVISGTYQRAISCKVINTTVRGIYYSGFSAGALISRCEATGCSGTAAIDIEGGFAFMCEAYGNTTHGFLMSANGEVMLCGSYGNTGASTDGFSNGSVGYKASYSWAYNNGRSGFDLTGNAGGESHLASCWSYGNAGEDYKTDGVKQGAFLVGCAGRVSAAGGGAGKGYNSTNLSGDSIVNYITLTADPATSSTNFAPNTTAGGGAALRGAGFGTWPRGTTTGFPDPGVQHQDAGGGGTTLIIVEED